MSDPRFARLSGTHYALIEAESFREETAFWYVRLERATTFDDLTVKVYDDALAASQGTAAYAASGTASVVGTVLTVPLTNNGAQAPTFTGASVVVTLDSVVATGTELWQVWLGGRLERAVLRVLRALRAINTTDGYSCDPTVERCMKQWEEAAPFPWIGVVGVAMRAEPSEIGGGTFGAGMRTEYTIRIVGHDQVSGMPTALFLFDDIRRAIALLSNQVPYDGPVNSGVPFYGAMFEGIENDLSVSWARERSTIEVNVIVRVDDDYAAITGGN